MEQNIFNDFQRLVDVSKSNETNVSLIRSLLPALNEFKIMLYTGYQEIVLNKEQLSDDDIQMANTLADMLHVITYDIAHNPPVKGEDIDVYVSLVDTYSTCENITRSIAQYGKGLLNEDSGSFLASEANLNELTQAFDEMLDTHKMGESVKFVQVA